MVARNGSPACPIVTPLATATFSCTKPARPSRMPPSVTDVSTASKPTKATLCSVTVPSATAGMMPSISKQTRRQPSLGTRLATTDATAYTLRAMPHCRLSPITSLPTTETTPCIFAPKPCNWLQATPSPAVRPTTPSTCKVGRLPAAALGATRRLFTSLPVQSESATPLIRY